MRKYILRKYILNEFLEIYFEDKIYFKGVDYFKGGFWDELNGMSLNIFLWEKYISYELNIYFEEIYILMSLFEIEDWGYELLWWVTWTVLCELLMCICVFLWGKHTFLEGFCLYLEYPSWVVVGCHGHRGLFVEERGHWIEERGRDSTARCRAPRRAGLASWEIFTRGGVAAVVGRGRPRRAKPVLPSGGWEWSCYGGMSC